MVVDLVVDAHVRNITELVQEILNKIDKLLGSTTIRSCHSHTSLGTKNIVRVCLFHGCKNYTQE